MLARWEPFRRGNLERLFDHFLGHDGDSRTGWFRPAIEVAEDENSLVVRAEIPVVDRDKLDVKVDGRLLTVSGTKEDKHEENEKTYHIYEARYGSFQRTLELPEYVDTEKTDADYTDGVLSVSFAKKEEAKPKQLELAVK